MCVNILNDIHFKMDGVLFLSQGKCKKKHKTKQLGV